MSTRYSRSGTSCPHVSPTSRFFNTRWRFQWIGLYGNQTLAQEETFAACIAAINAQLWAATKAGRVALIDVETQAAYYGKKQWFDERLWCQARQALSPSYLPPLAKAASDAILSPHSVGVKCVILDLDNTLWGGILGDDGPDLIELGAVGVGHAFQRVQQSLAELKNRGVLLAVCTKNDRAAVDEVLKTHPYLIIKHGDFAAISANFTDKATNILAIRDQLNLGLDAFVFLDDSAFERDQVRQILPDVQVPELPTDPADVIQALARWNLFEGYAATTAEDRERHRFYQADMSREVLRVGRTDLESYLVGLEMEAEALPFDAFTLPRVVQLFQRSNQFNLTTIRYSREELEALVADGAVGFSIRLVDRVGDNGIIAAVILRTAGQETLIDSWVMSCRVLGRGVEQLTLTRIVEEARQRGTQKVVGRYIRTAKNAMVGDLYPRLGFTDVRDAPHARFVLNVPSFVPSPVKDPASHAGCAGVDMTDFRTQVESVFREVFDDSRLEIFDAMQAKDVEGWDSLTHITLIMALEDKFGVKFTTREVMGFQNVGEMLQCLKNKLPE